MERNLIYILGAGRSGTTFFALLFSRSLKITWPGELHHLFNSTYNIKCSCGQSRNECQIWNDFNNYTLRESNYAMRHYGSYIFQFYSRKTKQKIISMEYNLFDQISPDRGLIIDSSKYLDRYKFIKANTKIKVVGYYLVRDPRGVVSSFMKQTSQSSRNFISAILYYLLVNMRIEIYRLFDKSITKVRYEDLDAYDIKLNFDVNTGDRNSTYEEHVLGTNRFMRYNMNAEYRVDEEWRKNMPRWKQLVVYVFTLPLCMLNKYQP